MFEQIFKAPRTVRRHREGPLADERARYLAQLAEGGVSPSTLRHAAFFLLDFAARIDLTGDQKVSQEQIDRTADDWARCKRPSEARSLEPYGSRERFRAVARAWLRFLGRWQPPHLPPQPYADLITDFTLSMRQERGLAESTITLRCGFVKKFFDRLASPAVPLHAVRLKQVEEVLAWQGRQGYTRGSLRAYVEALRAFFRHAERRGWCIPGIAAAITAPRIFRVERLPSGPSWEDVQRLLASAHTDRPKDIRDRAVILLLATYGFRVDEVRRMRLEDFDWEQEFISVTRSKQRQAQKYPLSRVVGEAVLRYLKEVRPRVKDRSLFLTLTAPYRGFRPGGLWPAVGPRVRALDIRVEHPGPHCLRHACAARLLSQGLSYKQIADHLGHRSLEATRIYAKVDLARLREVGNFDLGGLL
jgi:site-specific recombinase XerD